MVPTRTGFNEQKNTEQSLQNLSFDRDFNVLAVENLTYNPVSATLERQTNVGQGNASYTLSYTDGNLTTIEKTIGATTYTKTLSYTSGNLTGVTAWSV